MKRQEGIQFQMASLELADKPEDDCGKKVYGNERKIILRELTAVLIRIRNLQRNGRKEVTLKSADLPPEGEEECR